MDYEKVIVDLNRKIELLEHKVNHLEQMRVLDKINANQDRIAWDLEKISNT